MSDEFWEKNAEPWVQAIRDQKVESRKITNPAIIDEILRLRPSSVLDLGCGEGWIASQLLPKGIEYLGLDFSRALIRAARLKYPDACFDAVGYDDLVQERWKEPRKFDVVVFNFSLFEEVLRPLLTRAASLLEPNGTILVQTLHPCFALQPYEDGWRTEDFKAFPVPFEGTMKWYGRTLGSWVREIIGSGLKVQAVAEPLDRSRGVPVSLILALSIAV